MVDMILLTFYLVISLLMACTKHPRCVSLTSLRRPVTGVDIPDGQEDLGLQT